MSDSDEIEVFLLAGEALTLPDGKKFVAVKNGFVRLPRRSDLSAMRARPDPGDEPPPKRR